jgi:hypothetical protein
MPHVRLLARLLLACLPFPVIFPAAAAQSADIEADEQGIEFFEKKSAPSSPSTATTAIRPARRRSRAS